MQARLIHLATIRAEYSNLVATVATARRNPENRPARTGRSPRRPGRRPHRQLDHAGRQAERRQSTGRPRQNDHPVGRHAGRTVDRCRHHLLDGRAGAACPAGTGWPRRDCRQCNRNCRGQPAAIEPGHRSVAKRNGAGRNHGGGLLLGWAGASRMLGGPIFGLSIGTDLGRRSADFPENSLPCGTEPPMPRSRPARGRLRPRQDRRWRPEAFAAASARSRLSRPARPAISNPLRNAC